MMLAWSFKPIWSYSVLKLGKRDENRSRPVNYRGPVLLHSSGPQVRADFELSRAAAARMGGIDPATIPDQADLPHRALVGVARVAACRWFDGVPLVEPEAIEITRRVVVQAHGWKIRGCYVVELADVDRLPTVPYNGFLGLWKVDPTRLGAHEAVYRAAWRARGGA